jgi:ABC-type multidrug transport system ATPase subunit
MDEPFVGLDPVNVALLKEAFGEMRERGSTLIFSTHQMEMVEELCEAVALIDKGRLVLSGPIRDVSARPAGASSGSPSTVGRSIRMLRSPGSNRSPASASRAPGRTTPSSTSRTTSTPSWCCGRRSIAVSA